MATNVSVFWFSILILSQSYLLMVGSDHPKVFECCNSKVLKRLSYLAYHEEQFSISFLSGLRLARS